MKLVPAKQIGTIALYIALHVVTYSTLLCRPSNDSQLNKYIYVIERLKVHYG